MFPRRKRLSRAAFPAVLMHGRRRSSKHFSVVTSETADGYAIIIPKKVAHLSVTRHKIRRRTLAALRTIQLPRALIIFPHSSVHGVSYQDIKTELTNLIS